MPGASARAANTWLMTCTRQLTSQSASDAVSCPLRDRPALEKKMSTGPYLSSAAATSAWMSASSPTSQVTASPSMSPATFANRSRELLRSATTTPRAPAPAYARAVASPMPLAAPVTTQTLSLMCMVTSPALSGLIQPLVARLPDRQSRHQVEHRRRETCGTGEGGGRFHQYVDLHGAAELVILQDRRLVIRRRASAGDALHLGAAALRDAVGLVEQARDHVLQQRLVAHAARGLAGQRAEDRHRHVGQKLRPDRLPDFSHRRRRDRRIGKRSAQPCDP